jgi:hypothetical protein
VSEDIGCNGITFPSKGGTITLIYIFLTPIKALHLQTLHLASRVHMSLNWALRVYLRQVIIGTCRLLSD